MKLFQARAAIAVAIFALSLAACGGGGGTSSNMNAGALPQPNVGSASLSIVFPLPQAGGSHSLPLPQGYSGSISLAPNPAPSGTQLRLSVSGNGMAGSGAAPLSTTTTSNPFPLFITFQSSSTTTISVPGFTITFPRTVSVQGTFDVTFYDPTKPVSSSNPSFLGQAVISGQTLTFTPQPNATISVVAGMQYTFIVSRDQTTTSTSSVVLPVQSGTTQTLGTVGALGALANYQASTNSGFLTWETISGSPVGIPQLIFGDNPIESIVVSGSQALTLSNSTITGVFGNNSSSSSARMSAAFALRQPLATATATPAPGTFVPDPSPTVYGPFPATVNGNQTTFTVPAGLPLGGHKAWNFSLISVTACTPTNINTVCNDGTTNNLRASVNTNTQFEVLVSDSSGLLTGQYNLVVTGPCTTAGFNQNDNDTSEVPSGYNDNPTGPNAEFEVLSTGTTGTCTINATYNNQQVAQTTIAIVSPSSTLAVPFTLRPPVNSPSGTAISGTTL